jgi:MoxR-like ATPase
MADYREVPQQLMASICSVLIGKEEQVKNVIVTLLARGHVLIEDIPGVGKTLLALATANTLGVRFRRIQFTSDSLPSDVIGVNVYDPKTAEFEFKEGPIFTEVLLADEINRTSPRTQSALLEAMAEGKVSVDGTTYDLSEPFLVLATMNPVERFGSFELPESQLDRFMVSVSLGYPDRDQEREILAKDIEHMDAERLKPVVEVSVLHELQNRVRDVTLEDSIMEYILDLVRASREDPYVKQGLSSRGALHLKRAVQALALVERRDYAIPEDVRRMFVPVTQHRLVVTAVSGDNRGREHKSEIAQRLLDSVPAPI